MCQQIWTIYLRRLRIFGQEPRQWFLIMSPIIWIMLILCIIVAFLNLGMTMAGAEEYLQGTTQTLVGLIFPFFLNYGFCACSGIYILTPIMERETKTRLALNLVGLRNTAYWIGLFLADFTLYLIPVVTFFLFAKVTQIAAYSDHSAIFVTILATFGLALIPAIYTISHFFDNQSKAVRSIVPILLATGTILPLVSSLIEHGLISLSTSQDQD